MNLEPRVSAIEPERRRAQPQVSAWMEDGLEGVLTDKIHPQTLGMKIP
jgi:hypothetical protein